MKEKLCVSIIMSIYKEPVEWLVKSIESVINQTYSNVQVVLILDNPEYVAAKKLLLSYSEKYSNIVLIFNEKNEGLVKSLNKGLKFCTGEYIARMDADDIADIDRIQKQLKYLIDHNYDLIGSKILKFSEKKKTQTKTIYSYQACKKAIRVCPCMAHPSWFGKRVVFDMLEGYRNIDACEDYDFVIRADSLNFKIGNIPEVLLFYRDNEQSISHTKANRQYAISYYLSKEWRKGKIISVEELEKYCESLEYKKMISDLEEIDILEKKLENNKSVIGKLAVKIKLFKNKAYLWRIWVKIYMRCVRCLDGVYMQKN